MYLIIFVQVKELMYNVLESKADVVILGGDMNAKPKNERGIVIYLQ